MTFGRLTLAQLGDAGYVSSVRIPFGLDCLDVVIVHVGTVGVELHMGRFDVARSESRFRRWKRTERATVMAEDFSQGVLAVDFHVVFFFSVLEKETSNFFKGPFCFKVCVRKDDCNAHKSKINCFFWRKCRVEKFLFIFSCEFRKDLWWAPTPK